MAPRRLEASVGCSAMRRSLLLVTTAAALCAGWAAGYLVLFIPSGLGVREAVLLAALPNLAAAPLLAASVAHRLLGLLAEAVLAGATQLRAVRARRRLP